MPEFSLQKYLQFLDIYRITFMTTVPTILTMLHKYEHPERFNLKAVEVVTSGSAPLDGTLAASVSQKYLRAGVIVKQGWGMTETTCSVTGFSPDDHDDGKSIGWLNPNCAAKIVPVGENEGSGEPHSPTTTGELWVAGPQMMKGYWHNEKATKETVVESDGYRWIRTGDLAYIDGRGCIYIFDRLKVSK
jgi:acyl-CoA synthetase (AMP-forming)/AMP-acid ligase II